MQINTITATVIHRHQECCHLAHFAYLGLFSICSITSSHIVLVASSVTLPTTRLHEEELRHWVSGNPVLALQTHHPLEKQSAPKWHGKDHGQLLVPLPRSSLISGATPTACWACQLLPSSRRTLGSLLHLCLPWPAWQLASACGLSPLHSM